MLILLRFLFIRKNEKPNDINEHGVKSDRLLGRFISILAAFIWGIESELNIKRKVRRKLNRLFCRVDRRWSGR